MIIQINENFYSIIEAFNITIKPYCHSNNFGTVFLPLLLVDNEPIVTIEYQDDNESLIISKEIFNKAIIEKLRLSPDLLDRYPSKFICYLLSEKIIYHETVTKYFLSST